MCFSCGASGFMGRGAEKMGLCMQPCSFVRFGCQAWWQLCAIQQCNSSYTCWITCGCQNPLWKPALQGGSWDDQGSCGCECQVQTAQLEPDTPLQAWPPGGIMEKLPSASSREQMEVEWLKASPGLLGGGDCYGNVVVLSRSHRIKLLSSKALNTLRLEFICHEGFITLFEKSM